MTNQDPGSGMYDTRPDASTSQFHTQQGSNDSPVDAVAQKASQVADTAKDQAGQVMDKARQQAATQIETQKGKATDTLGVVANAIRQTGDQLRNQDQAAIAGYADTAADQIDRLSTYLQNRDVGQMVNEVEHLARRQPALFLGGAFLLGLVGARFIKSSSDQARAAQGYGNNNYNNYNYGGQYSGNYGGGQRGYSTGYSAGYSRNYPGNYSTDYTRGDGDAYSGGYSGTTGGYAGNTDYASNAGSGYASDRGYAGNSNSDYGASITGSVPPARARTTLGDLGDTGTSAEEI